jgi:UDPglucose 6-dehydrogenase
MQFPTVRYCSDPYEVAIGCDALVLVTEWEEFARLDMARVRRSMRQPVLVDGRNLYDPAEMARLGFRYRGIGVGNTGPLRSWRLGFDSAQEAEEGLSAKVGE